MSADEALAAQARRLSVRVDELAEHVVNTMQAWTTSALPALCESQPELVMAINVAAARAVERSMARALTEFLMRKARG